MKLTKLISLVTFFGVLALAQSQDNVDTVFRILFEAGSPLKDLLQHANGWGAEKLYNNFLIITKAAGEPEYPHMYQRGQKILREAQDIFDKDLQHMNYPQPIKIEDYLRGLFEYKTTKTVADEKVFQLMKHIYKLIKDAMAKLQQAAATSKPTHEPAKSQLTPEPVKQQPTPEPAKPQLMPEPIKPKNIGHHEHRPMVVRATPEGWVPVPEKNPQQL